MNTITYRQLFHCFEVNVLFTHRIVSFHTGYKWRIYKRYSVSSQVGFSYIIAYMGSRSVTNQTTYEYSGLLHDDIGYLIQLNPEYKILNWFSVYGIIAYRRALIKPLTNVAGSPMHENRGSFFGGSDKELEMDFSGMNYGLGLRFVVF